MYLVHNFRHRITTTKTWFYGERVDTLPQGCTVVDGMLTPICNIWVHGSYAMPFETQVFNTLEEAFAVHSPKLGFNWSYEVKG